MSRLTDYPTWLAQHLFDGLSESDWKASQPVLLTEFFNRHNLHDSLWYGLWVKPNFHATAALRWDTVHAVAQYPDQFPQSIWMDWPILLIDFQVPPYQILFDSEDWEVDFRPVIGHVSSRIVSPEDREQMLNSVLSQRFLKDNVREFWLDQSLHHTIFEGIIKSEIHIFHAPEVRLLCKSWDGKPLTIPDV